MSLGVPNNLADSSAGPLSAHPILLETSLRIDRWSCTGEFGVLLKRTDLIGRRFDEPNSPDMRSCGNPCQSYATHWRASVTCIRTEKGEEGEEVKEAEENRLTAVETDETSVE